MKKLIWMIIWISFGGLSIFIGLHPLKYLMAEQPILLLSSKSAALLGSYLYNITFYFHIIFGGIALMIGWLQFHKGLRKKFPRLHRMIGKTYILSVILSGIPGFYIALHASGGLSPKLGFSLGAILWVFLAYKGYSSIRKGEVEAHKHYLMYNYAGTFGAVTLRLWLPILIALFGEFLLAYQVVAWLSWIPNMIIVYFVIHRNQIFASNQTKFVFNQAK